MPRIGRSFPPQWVEPNIGGPERALGAEPPQAILPLPTLRMQTITVTLAVHARRSWTRRFPAQWYEPSETDIGKPRPNAASIIVYPERALGPDPPTLLAPPSLPPAPITVALASLSRRNTETRRFPLQTIEGITQQLTANYIAGSVTLPTSLANGTSTTPIQAILLVGGSLFALAQTGGVIKWVDPSDLNTYVGASLPTFNGSVLQAAYMIYDAGTNQFLVSCVDSSGISTDLIIVTVNPSTLAMAILVDDATVTAVTSRAIASDGTWVYTYSIVSSLIQVRKYLLSTGAFVSSISPFGAGYNVINTMLYDPGSSRVYVAGRHSGAPAKDFAGYVDAALSTSAQIDIPDNGAPAWDEESALAGGFYWATQEVTGTTKTLLRVAADMSAYTLVDTGIRDQNYGARFDGTSIVCTVGKDPNPGYLLLVDPSTSAVTGSVQIPQASLSNPNSSVYDSVRRRYYVANFATNSVLYSVTAENTAFPASVTQGMLYRQVGPHPPNVRGAPTLRQETVTMATPLLAVERRLLQIRQPKSLLFPPQTLAKPPPFLPAITVGPPVRTRPRPQRVTYTQARYLSPLAVVTTLSVYCQNATQSRRQTETRRFPLQGWGFQVVSETEYVVITDGLSNNAEGGTTGVTPTTSDTGSGVPFTAVNKGPVAGILDYSNAESAHGTLSYQMATRGTIETNDVSWTNGSPVSSAFGRFYFSLDSTPGSQIPVLRARSLGNSAILGYMAVSTGRALQILNHSEGLVFSGSAALAVGQFYRIEWNVVANVGGSSTAGTIQYRLYRGDSNTVIEDSGVKAIVTAATTTLDTIEFGIVSPLAANLPTATGFLYFDDLVAFASTWPGPASVIVNSQVLRRPNLGVWPPQIVALPSQQPQIIEVEMTVAVMGRAQAQRRAPHSHLFGFIPQVSAQPPPPIQVATTKTRPRHVASFYTEALDLFPLAVVTTPGQLVVQTHFVRIRPRPARSSLSLVIVTTTTFVAPPITTSLVVPDRLERRHFNSFLSPPTVLQTFAGPRVALARIRPRPFAVRHIVPATLEPEAVFLAERQPRIWLVRTRPRHTQGTRLSYTVYPQTSRIAVTLVKTRPRPTHVARRGLIFYPQAGVGFIHLAKTRPRPTTKFVQPPATLQPYAVTVAEDTVRTALTRTRPRPTTRRIAPPTTLQVFTGPKTPLVRTRPRPTEKYVAPPATLEPEEVALLERQIRVVLTRTRPRHTQGTRLGPLIFYPATSEITVALTRTRPRPTRHTLGPLIFYAQSGVGFTHLTRTRPRPTTKFFVPTPITTVAVAFYGPQVTLVRTRPRRTLAKLGYTVYPATSEITVATVRTRPRKTIHSLTAVTYPQTGVGLTHLTRTRPRHTISRLAPPATLQPYSVTVAEDTVRVTLVRTRPRPTTRRLTPPTTLQVFHGPSTPLVRTRPRPTRHVLGPLIFYPATSVIRVALVRTRPRPTRHSLTAVSYPQTGIGFLHVTRTRPRPTTRFLSPPATLTPYVIEVAEETIRVVLTRTRPRPTTRRLAPPTVLQTFSGPETPLVRTRPRKTRWLLAPPTVIRIPSVEQREDTITTALVHTRPRPTSKFIIPPLVKTFPPVVTTLLPAKLVQTRPRPTRKYLEPPTVVIPLPTLRMQTIAVALVRTRPRPTRHTLGPLRFYKQTSTIKVTAVRTRPRRTHWFLTAVRYPATSEIQVTLARTRPRPTSHHLTAPTVLKTFTAPRTPLVKTRPRPTRYFVKPPATLEPESVQVAEREERTLLARIRPRKTRTFLRPPTVTAVFVANPVRIVATRTRPRPQAVHLRPPTRLRPPETTVHVHLTTSRPRPTHALLRAPTVVTEPPVVTTLAVHLVRTRPSPTTRRLSPPTVIAPPTAPVKVPITVVLAVQARLALIPRRPHFHLGPPTKTRISLHFKAAPPESAWRTDRMTGGWDPDEPDAPITTGPPEPGWDADTPDPDWKVGPPA